MSSDIFMHDISNPEDEFLWIKSEQDKILDLLSLKVKKIIKKGRSLDSSKELEDYVKLLEVKQKIKLIKYLALYLPLEEQAKLIRNLSSDDLNKLTKSLPPRQKRIIRGWRSMISNGQTTSLSRLVSGQELFLQFFNSEGDLEENIKLVKYLTLQEQLDVFEYLKYSKNQIWLFKSFSESDQKKVFKLLQNSDEKFRYYKSLSSEDRKKLYREFGQEDQSVGKGKVSKDYPADTDDSPIHAEQLSFFQSLESAEQVRLYEELGKNEKATVCKALPPEDQSRIFNSLKHQDQIHLFKCLNPEEQLIFFQYLEKEDRLELYYDLDPDKKANVFSGLPEEDIHLIQDYISLKNAQDPQIIFFNSLDESDQRMLYDFLKEDEQKKLLDHLKAPIESEIEVTERGLPADKSQEWAAQFQAFKNLKGLTEQAEFFTDLSGEDSRSLFRNIDKADQQVELFKALGSDKQIALFTNLDSEEKAKLYKSLPEKALQLLEGYIESKNKHLDFFMELEEADQIKLYRLLGEEDQKKLKKHFNQSHVDRFNASKFKEHEAAYFIDQAREELSKTFSMLDSEAKQVTFFEDRNKEDAKFIFTNIQDWDKQVELFNSLAPNDQDALFRSLELADQDRFFIYLKHSEEQISSFQSMNWQEKVSFFESLEWEKKVELFGLLDSQEYTWLLYTLEEQHKLFNGLANPEQQVLLDAMENDLVHLREVHSNLKRWEKIKKSGAQVESNLEHFYSYQFHHPRFIQIIVVILGLAAMGVALNYTLNFFNKKPVEPIYIKVEGIKRLGEMHLVKQQYESVIPITKQKEDRKGNFKKERLQFLLIAPIEVTGYIDFGSLELEVLEDSVMEITLPEPQISKAYLDFGQTEEFRTEGKFRVFGQYLERMNHKEAYYDIARGINNAKERVRISAEKEHFIKEETQEKAHTFLRNFGSTLGYRVKFREIADVPLQPAVASDSTAVQKEEKEEGFSLLSRLSEFGNSVLNK